jgi:protoheme IX farnesyltransferase
MKAAKELIADINVESTVYDFCTLLKPRVMSLVVFSGIAGIYLAPGTIHPFIALVATLCIALGSGASGAINMWYERDVDALMARTSGRPIPQGKILPQHALEFGVVMAVISVVLMFVATNFTAAFLLLQAILFYVFIYTIWLKRRTPYNIVIGGAAGAFPPMIGWAAVTGSIALEGVILFLIIFMWTPPHFWALALYKNEDYTKAGIPMLPVVAGSEATRFQMLIYTIGLVIISFLPFVFEMSGWLYTIGASILGVQFFYHAYGLYQDYSETKSRAMFKFSLLYLFLIFVLLMADKWAMQVF